MMEYTWGWSMITSTPAQVLFVYFNASECPLSIIPPHKLQNNAHWEGGSFVCIKLYNKFSTVWPQITRFYTFSLSRFSLKVDLLTQLAFPLVLEAPARATPALQEDDFAIVASMTSCCCWAATISSFPWPRAFIVASGEMPSTFIPIPGIFMTPGLS